MGRKTTLENLQGQRAVISGAGSGLGRELALLLAGRGFRVGIADINPKGAKQTLSLVEDAGGYGEMFVCDVSSAGQMLEMADYFFTAWGGVDLLIPCAGVAAGGTLGDIPLEDWHWLMDVNFWGTLHACHAFIPRMRAQGSGYIINIASAAGMFCLPEMASYNASKAAIIALSESIKSELAPYGIGVTVACPSFFSSPFGDNVRYTDPYQLEFCEAAFGYASLDARAIAGQVLAAADRGRMYLPPHFTVNALLWLKRLSPGAFREGLAWLYKKGIGRPFLLWAARHGLT